MKCGWREGNQIQLLENGDQFYPAVFEAIAQAQQKIILETFILFEDEVGKKLHTALLKAAQRGVKAEVLLDGYGSPDLSDAFVGELTSAGVIFRYYDPRPRLLGLRTNIFRRMHRKIVVIDDRIAFVGGINYSAEHMSDYGPQAKQDYAVRVEGPVVADILQFEVENLPGQSPARRWWKRHHQAEENRHPGEAQALFVWRDNEEHRDDIEHRRPARIPRALLFYSPVAGAGVLSDPGEPGEEAAGEKRAGDGEINLSRRVFAFQHNAFYPVKINIC